jgi:uroporphyrinogen-III synthase
MLDGRGVLVTRPRHQAAGLMTLIAARGGDPYLFPTIEIAPVNDPAHAMAHLARLAAHDHVIFASANAVTFGLRLAPPGWPAAVDAIAVGPATAQALRDAGITPVLMPVDHFDSEGVLELDVLRRPAGQRILIVRGVGGRDLLARTLTERGATVDIAEVYTRDDPRADTRELIARWRAGRIQAVICTASESVRNLYGALAKERELLDQTPVFVPHARIAQTVRALCRTDVVETATGDDEIVRAIEHFFAKVID